MENKTSFITYGIVQSHESFLLMGFLYDWAFFFFFWKLAVVDYLHFMFVLLRKYSKRISVLCTDLIAWLLKEDSQMLDFKVMSMTATSAAATTVTSITLQF